MGVQSEENHDPQSVIVGQPQSLKSSVRRSGDVTLIRNVRRTAGPNAKSHKLSYSWGAGLRMGVRQNGTILLHLSFSWGGVGMAFCVYLNFYFCRLFWTSSATRENSRARSLSLRMGNRTGQYSLFLHLIRASSPSQYAPRIANVLLFLFTFEEKVVMYQHSTVLPSTSGVLL